MTKGMYHYIREAWKKPDVEILRKRLTEWRKGKTIERVENPLRLDRARALGYKAKPGFVIVRVRIRRGGRSRAKIMGGRRSKRQNMKKVLQVGYQWVAEQRVARKYPNMEVLNSYWIGKDGMNYFYEVILVDVDHPQIKSDKTINWICEPANKNRVFRGLTGSAKLSKASDRI
jgi:large subunit ribosomal protein L15e